MSSGIIFDSDGTALQAIAAAASPIAGARARRRHPFYFNA